MMVHLFSVSTPATHPPYLFNHNQPTYLHLSATVAASTRFVFRLGWMVGLIWFGVLLQHFFGFIRFKCLVSGKCEYVGVTCSSILITCQASLMLSVVVGAVWNVCRFFVFGFCVLVERCVLLQSCRCCCCCVHSSKRKYILVRGSIPKRYCCSVVGSSKILPLVLKFFLFWFKKDMASYVVAFVYCFSFWIVLWRRLFFTLKRPWPVHLEEFQWRSSSVFYDFKVKIDFFGMKTDLTRKVCLQLCRENIMWWIHIHS